MGISNKGAKAKSITSCDNAFVTNIMLLPLRWHYAFAQKHHAAAASLALRFRAKNICWPETLERATRVKRLIGRPQEALLCAKAKRQQQMFFCAKAKRQQQSAQSERKSTPRFAEE
ncbi:hypothetical protein C7Y47_15765 [Lysinibacillus sphaericus]|uniref:Uncharacterized protein n=1 Tax=Lysinibacillus sphaericus TaxID=1421 RepID=A0A544UDZ7_LYSSH|nr:hypothetical protein [Lysinibacillus sp. SDF0037]TQR30583.1 hypothetical protein C7Y47_15765 [Lysinibacillus sp. SDF0037]